MSTRGLMGIKKKNKLKASYNHFDSYISGLGKDIIDTINNIPEKERIEKLTKTYDNIVLVKEQDKPTQDIINYCMSFNTINLNVSNGSIEDMYCLLHNAQGNLKLYLDGFKYMTDNKSFLEDALFCEYAYIINLDTKTLDITFGWKNRQTKSYDLLNLNYEEIEKEINDLERVDYE